MEGAMTGDVKNRMKPLDILGEFTTPIPPMSDDQKVVLLSLYVILKTPSDTPAGGMDGSIGKAKFKREDVMELLALNSVDDYNKLTRYYREKSAFKDLWCNDGYWANLSPSARLAASQQWSAEDTTMLHFLSQTVRLYIPMQDWEDAGCVYLMSHVKAACLQRVMLRAPRIPCGANGMLIIGGQDAKSGFTLLDEISRGGYATVRRATYLNSMYAVKSPTSRNATPHLENEIAIYGHLPSHSNLLQFILSFRDEYYHPCLVLELCNRGSLDDEIAVMDNKHYYNNRIVPIMVQVLRGVIHLHGNGVVHYDIKPSNIGVISSSKHHPPLVADISTNPSTTKVTYKLMDLNTSQFMTEGGMAPFKAFTPAYAPPEALTHQQATLRGVDFDAFSCGMTFVCMLTGMPEATDELADEIRGGKVARIDACDWIEDTTREVVKGLLHTDPTQRLNPLQALERLSPEDTTSEPSAKKTKSDLTPHLAMMTTGGGSSSTGGASGALAKSDQGQSSSR